MTGSFCVWFTGLSASGKTTLATGLKQALVNRGLKVELLDGDEIRTSLSRDLGYSRQDRETHLLRVAYLARLLVRHGVVTIVAAISPFRNIREAVRREVGEIVEVYINAPLEVCIGRDPKGLYRRALAGEIKDFTGLDQPYEAPDHPDIELRTHLETPAESLNRLIKALEVLQRIPVEPEAGYSEEEIDLLQRRLQDLGYL